MTATVITVTLGLIALYATTLSILWARAAYASMQCAIAMDKGDMRVYHKWSQEASRRRSLAMRADVVYRGIDRWAYRKGGQHHGS